MDDKMPKMAWVGMSVMCMILLLIVFLFCWRRFFQHTSFSRSSPNNTHASKYSYITNFNSHELIPNITILSAGNTSKFESIKDHDPAKQSAPQSQPLAVPCHPPPPPPLPQQRRKGFSYYHSVRGCPVSPESAEQYNTYTKTKYKRKRRQPKPISPSGKENDRFYKVKNNTYQSSSTTERHHWVPLASNNISVSSLVYSDLLPSPPAEPPEVAISILSQIPFITPAAPAVVLQIHTDAEIHTPRPVSGSDPPPHPQSASMGQMSTLQLPGNECVAVPAAASGEGEWCHIRNRSCSRE